MQFPEHILVFILRFLPLEFLLVSVALPCKRLHNLIDNVCVLWETFEFSFPLSLNDRNINYIFQHARGFKLFLIPGTTYSFCSTPLIDLNFTIGYSSAQSLYRLDISDSPVSTFGFLCNLPHLEILNVSHCRNLMDFDFSATNLINYIYPARAFLLYQLLKYAGT
jgi:Leucine-rich repeat (LRR) protein